LKRLFQPMLFMMANVPDAEKNLELLMSMLQVTTESVKNIKSGIDNFHASVLNLAQTASGQAPAAKQEPASAPVIVADSTPTIQIPFADPPVS